MNARQFANIIAGRLSLVHDTPTCIVIKIRFVQGSLDNPDWGHEYTAEAP